ncbi:MAG: right-handed parallel beta-helix repeat-containing protein [Prevotellaceae bacterium]|nr:right-handed parallel beta-helix repeat-containing protein [Prevotellaceae bacterium]
MDKIKFIFIGNIFRYISGVMCVFLLLSCSSKNAKEDEQDTSVYVIDLAKFDIPDSDNYKDSAVAVATTRGINNALNYAKENGYTTVRFPQRQYAVISKWQGWGWVVIPEHEMKGIVVPSDMTLELGEAVFRLLPNSQVTYSLFFIFEVDNVTVNGGHLIGDRYEHDYSETETLGSQTHEWGFGFNIAHSRNITINDSKVEQMSGDAIIINSYLPDGAKPNDNVKITRCELFDCRRQGISLIAGNNSELSHNHIYNIKNGTPPMCGIDVEVEAACGCVGNYTQIHHNLIENVEGGSIVCHTGDYIDVYENTVYNLIASVYSRYVKIYRNTLYNSQILIYNADNATEYDNIVISD